MHGGVACIESLGAGYAPFVAGSFTLEARPSGEYASYLGRLLRSNRGNLTSPRDQVKLSEARFPIKANDYTDK